jgi:hypothetical protein
MALALTCGEKSVHFAPVIPSFFVLSSARSGWVLMV